MRTGLNTPPRYKNANPINPWQKHLPGAINDQGKPIGTLNPNVINDPDYIDKFGDKNDFLP